jgi:SAM-dependent methyltransferase
MASEQKAPDVVTEVLKARSEIGLAFLKGRGVEVGPGDRPFPIPPAAHTAYGDIRKHEALADYFRTTDVTPVQDIDAQTFAGIDNDSLDFVISAHVIEHLRNPIGSIVNAIRILKVGGIHILVVPDMRYTFDRNRPETTVDHVLTDFADGGASTLRDSYEEHLRYVHPYLTGETYPEADIQRYADENVKNWRAFDCHFHAWSQDGFEKLLSAAKEFAPFKVEATVFVVNENIFVLRKLARASAS